MVIANAEISADAKHGMESNKQIQQVFDTNLQEVLNTILPIIPKLIQNNYGQIAIISSLAGVDIVVYQITHTIPLVKRP
ncbi:MAG: SDR family NAD(P)-dependent oxidoreductase [Rickettsiales endosymbiont of Dermacentor nuttalli]